MLPLPPGAASLLKQGLGQLLGRSRPRGRWCRSRYLWSGGSRRDDLFGIFHGIIWRFLRGPQFIQVIPHFGGYAIMRWDISWNGGGFNPPQLMTIDIWPHKIMHHVRTASTSGDMIWLFFLRAFWMVSPYCLEMHLAQLWASPRTTLMGHWTTKTQEFEVISITQNRQQVQYKRLRM